jgi:hypothetical protein
MKDGALTQRAGRSEAEDHLLTLLGSVNDWLRFAETKNATLVALGGLSLTGILTYVAGVEDFMVGAAVLLTAGATLWLLSLLLGMFSFMPQTKAMEPRTALKDQVDDSDNLYYFAHLANYSNETLLTALGAEQGEKPRGRFERDLANQVIINSRITLQKFDLFDYAARWWVAGTLLVSSGIFWTLFGGR